MSDPQQAMDPLEAGGYVLRGMRNNDLYIFSHPGADALIENRNAALMASVPKKLRLRGNQRAASDADLRDSVYSRETERMRCAPASVSS
jgi:hypothetical protein